MATITFTGPDPLNPAETATTVVTVPDELVLLAVQAACTRFGYQPTVKDEKGEDHTNPEGPGTFAIWRTIDTWKSWIIEDQSRIAKSAAVSQVLTNLKPLDDAIAVAG